MCGRGELRTAELASVCERASLAHDESQLISSHQKRRSLRIYTRYVTPSLAEIDWKTFLQRPLLEPAPVRLRDDLRARSILITGAGGSIGSALALRCMAMGVRSLSLLEASESRLFHLQQRCSSQYGSLQPTFLLGNVTDPGMLEEAFARSAPDLVFHAAAFKHVPLLEEQTIAAIANNVLATGVVSDTASAFGACVVLVSTDKAVMPASILGATKRAAEQIVLNHHGVVVRLGNVLASSDSVAEIFAHQIASGGPITVTDPDARRFFLTLDEAVDIVLAASTEENCLLIPALDRQHLIADLARFLASELTPERPTRIVFTQLRAGDREAERLYSDDEVLGPEILPSLHCVTTPRIPPHTVAELLTRMRTAVVSRDRSAALECLLALVPEFVPHAKAQSIAPNHDLRVMR